MNKIVSTLKQIGLIIIFLLLLFSGGIAKLWAFFANLILIEFSAPEISKGSEIVVNIITYASAYSLVGAICKTTGLFDGKLMSVGYFILSTIIGVGLTHLVELIETHWLTCTITLGLIFVTAIVITIVRVAKEKRNELCR